MAATKIEWAERVWNPLTGCTKVSAGCKNCYAERTAKRLKGMGVAQYRDVVNAKGWTGKIELVEHMLTAPLHWRKPRTVFVNSMSDLYHRDVPPDFVDRVYAITQLARQHTYMVLTKRPERRAEYMAATSRERAWIINEAACDMVGRPTHQPLQAGQPVQEWPLSNVCEGTSVENQEQLDKRAPYILACPGAVTFLSIEPMLGPINLWAVLSSILGRIDGVILGGESGPGARPMHPDWVRSVRDQCQEAGVSFFFKQWGGTNKKAAGRILDGRTWDDMPERKIT